MFGALQAIPQDVLEAAKVDGAGAIRTAWSIKLPLVKKYIVYMLILCFAAALQIFVEPMLFYSITNAGSLLVVAEPVGLHVRVLSRVSSARPRRCR